MKQGLDGEGDHPTKHWTSDSEMVEQEVTDYPEQGHYQRRPPEQEHRGYRNGYEPGRVRSAQREIVVQIPQVRDGPEIHMSRRMAF